MKNNSVAMKLKTEIPYQAFLSLGFTSAIITELLYAIWVNAGGTYDKEGDPIPPTCAGKYLYPEKIILCPTKKSKAIFDKNREEIMQRVTDFFDIYGQYQGANQEIDVNKCIKVDQYFEFKVLDEIHDPSHASDSDLLDEQVLKIIKAVKRSEDRILFCLTGGRAAMSIAITNALSLFKGPLDTVYDVQVEDQFTKQGFWFPYPKKSAKDAVSPKFGEPFKSSDATVMLTKQFIPPMMDLLYSGKNPQLIDSLTAKDFRQLADLSACASNGELFLQVLPFPKKLSEHTKDPAIEVFNREIAASYKFTLDSMTTYLLFRILCRIAKIEDAISQNGSLQQSVNTRLLNVIKSDKIYSKQESKLTAIALKNCRNVSMLFMIELLSFTAFNEKTKKQVIDSIVFSKERPLATVKCGSYISELEQYFKDIKNSCEFNSELASSCHEDGILARIRDKDSNIKDKPNYAPSICDLKHVSGIRESFIKQSMTKPLLEQLAVIIEDKRNFKIALSGKNIELIDYDKNNNQVPFTPEHPDSWGSWWASEFFEIKL